MARFPDDNRSLEVSGPLPPLGRYLRLYGLQLVAESVSYEVVLRVRVATTQFVTALLPQEVQSLWQDDPPAGVTVAHEAIAPRVEQLRAAGPEAWQQLGLDTPPPPEWARLADWQQGLTGRPLQAWPEQGALVPYQPPSRHAIARSLDNTTRVLRLVQVTLEVANAARQLWQDWQIGQAQQQLLATRQLLLDDALRATEAGQRLALDKALNPSFVERYLAAGDNELPPGVLFGTLDGNGEDD